MTLKPIASLAAGALLLASLVACSSGGDSTDTSAPPATTDATEATSEAPPAEEPTAAPENPAAPSGDLLVLTHRTDLEADGTLAGYVAEFQKSYPDVTISFEAITDYDNDVSMRLPTGDFGDVLSLPEGVANDQLAAFFEPFGTVDELSGQYQFLTSFASGGNVYALAQGGIATGVLYNKRIFAEAGVTEPPTTIAAFLDALKAVKDKTDAIPLYTNYKDGWPLGGLNRNMGAATGNAAAKNDMAANDAPWAEGSDAYYLDSLIYDAVAAGLTEADPTTTNWEESKTLFATGAVATLVLQSWAISQMAQAATDAGADPADVGFLPVPSAVDGKSFAAVIGDRYYAINKNSPNKEAARAWVDFMLNESPYAADQGFVSTVKSDPLPSNLGELTALGTQIFEPVPAPAGSEDLFDTIDAAAEIGWSTAPYRQALVDQARAGTAKADAFAGLNEKWAAARATIG